MKEAVARSCMWFFGTIIFAWFFTPSFIEGDGTGTQFAKLVLAGFVVGGVVFCKDWYEMERAKRLDNERLRNASTREDGTGEG